MPKWGQYVYILPPLSSIYADLVTLGAAVRTTVDARPAQQAQHALLAILVRTSPSHFLTAQESKTNIAVCSSLLPVLVKLAELRLLLARRTRFSPVSSPVLVQTAARPPVLPLKHAHKWMLAVSRCTISSG